MSGGDDFEWDEAKRLATIGKHGLDFRLARGVFDGEPLIARSDHDGEERWIAINWLNDRTVAVVFTYRGARKRLITARKARTDEKKRFLDRESEGR